MLLLFGHAVLAHRRFPISHACSADGCCWSPSLAPFRINQLTRTAWTPWTSPCKLLLTTARQQHACLPTASTPPWPCRRLQVSTVLCCSGSYSPRIQLLFCVQDARCSQCICHKLTHTTDTEYVCLGKYNESAFKGLDYIISRAAHYGIKLILTFGDEWNTADSKINYLEWGNATDNSNEFFTSPTIQGFYKDHILAMVNRNVSSQDS